MHRVLGGTEETVSLTVRWLRGLLRKISIWCLNYTVLKKIYVKVAIIEGKKKNR